MQPGIVICFNAAFIWVVLDIDEADNNEGIDALRYLFLSIFSAEMVLKLYAFGPNIYFSDWGNCYDFAVVFVSPSTHLTAPD